MHKKKLLIVQNIGHEGPGMLLDLLDEYHIGFERYDLSRGDSIPDPRCYNALVVLGGPQSANDRTPQILHEVQRVREALHASIPFLGICLGLQILTVAAGGKVVPSTVKEVGFNEPGGEPYMVHLTPDGRQDPLFRGLPESLRVFQLHGETVVPEPEMVLLATGKGCENQVLRIGSNAWGLQCHFEMTGSMFETWTEIDPDLMKMDRKLLLDEFEKIRTEYAVTGRTLLLNFLALAGLVD
jgi:GMP synthase-like glutamine amidotransferase